MLSTAQKAQILARTGMIVPSSPLATASGGASEEQWRKDIDDLFAGYAAARAARSIREAEAARLMTSLRRANSLSTQPGHPADSHED